MEAPYQPKGILLIVQFLSPPDLILSVTSQPDPLVVASAGLFTEKSGVERQIKKETRGADTTKNTPVASCTTIHQPLT